MRIIIFGFAILLGGCVYYPNNYGYYGGPPLYGPAVYGPPVGLNIEIPVGGSWHSGWGHSYRGWGGYAPHRWGGWRHR